MRLCPAGGAPPVAKNERRRYPTLQVTGRIREGPNAVKIKAFETVTFALAWGVNCR